MTHCRRTPPPRFSVFYIPYPTPALPAGFPFRAYLTYISMPDGIHVNEAFSILARLFHRGLHCVYAAVVDHLLPELLRLSLYETVVA